MNRLRLRPTVWGVIGGCVATTVLSRPSAHGSTIRARRATCGAVRDRCASESRVTRSSGLTTNGVFGRPVRMLCLLIEQTNGTRNLFSLFQGQDTRFHSPLEDTLTLLGCHEIGRLAVEAPSLFSEERSFSSSPQPGWPTLVRCSSTPARSDDYGAVTAHD